MAGDSTDRPRAPATAEAQTDPETVIGPLLHMFTRLARANDASFDEGIRLHLIDLARHPAVDIQLRLVAGAIALEPVAPAPDRRGRPSP
jgi:hypothetical protein